MSFATRGGQVKAPDSMAQVVVALVQLKSEARPTKDNHIRVVSTRASKAKTYFIVGSSHPMNNRTVHVTGNAELGSRLETTHGGCSLQFYRGANKLGEKNYLLADLMKVAEQILVFMDAVALRMPLSQEMEIQRKGEL